MPTLPSALRHGALAFATLLLVACGGGSPGTGSGPDSSATAAGSGDAEAREQAEALRSPPPSLSSVGERLFNEPRLSASGRLSCAGCHVAAQAHADRAGSFLPVGGLSVDQQGLRSSPSLRYLNGTPAFSIDAQGRPHGGLFWDGRANDRAAQARGPLFAANEMANADVASYVRRLRTAPAFADLLSASGLPASATDAQLLDASLQALARYQQQDPAFAPFSSKFDAVQDGRARFSEQEARGFAAFTDPRKGNCAACHSTSPPPNAPAGARALFTNHAYFALGVPRNRSVATQDPTFFDLGLCGPQRKDLSAQTTLCGKFRVPSLRNVALTAPYFHNARFQTLEEVVGFYATRELDPARWYPVLNGQVQRYDDLPAVYQANVHRGPPFDRRPGQLPALGPQDVSDIVSFLKTLSDGFQAPAATQQ
ncbi:c-type cytochrome [Mitsuaria sp. WAJ17]|uniref:cytochrome-c peroxidase n=1 Tax=Mitsuaria sp. WAJ17 TaxID=2761452 RepID=UPI0015FFB60E|nr:cytochrome c peroxidase [Mitsuaria sp. WAJ17]MBB2486960.1 c-type cytochrome [Mitsuaria sp. WAJ17]